MAGERFLFPRDTAANWTAENPVLLAGEIGVESDTAQLKVGNGANAWADLPYFTPTGSLTSALFDAIAEPSAPAADSLIAYAGTIAGRVVLRMKGPSGISTILQPFLGRNRVGYWNPPGNANTVPGVFGYRALTAVGTATARNVATTNMFTRMRRLGYVSAASAGSLTSQRINVAQFTSGTGTGLGGFFKVCRFGISDAAAVAGARMFVGVSSATNAPTNVEPSTLLDCIGVGHGAADTTLHIFYGGSAAQTPIDLGANFPADTRNTDPYELALFSPSSVDGRIYWEVTRLNTNNRASGFIDSGGGTTGPGSATLLSGMRAYRTNNATALAVGIDLISDYIETDQ